MVTFGWSFLQFARSVDTLHQDAIDTVKELVSAHFLGKTGIDACYFCVHRAGAILDNQSVLSTVWSSEADAQNRFVRRFEGDANESPSLRALAYNEGRCLWITVKNEADQITTLDGRAPSDLQNHWPDHEGDNASGMASYISLHDKPCRTLVALPLVHAGQKLGVLVLEFDRRIPCTPGAKQEADRICRAIAKIMWLSDAVAMQQEGTRRALEALKDNMLHAISSLDPPRMFFAFPGNSDETVVTAIKDILIADYSDRLNLIAWDTMNDPGQITDQIITEISRCRYGICYLSQLAGDDTDNSASLKFVDNSNVLIEAGMLDVLVHNRHALTNAWIPVRESADLTAQVPFDFVAARMIEVPRDADGTLQLEEFQKLLRSRLDALISE